MEFAAIGPVPLAGQLLADLGADVVCIDRRSATRDPYEVNRRNKRSIAIDLKQNAGIDLARRLIAGADILLEGFRPGVMERLGLGPGDLGDRIIYGRMTGWGQTGPLSRHAGHDINYLAITGALHAIGNGGAPPAPPLNLVADFGGGALFLVMGVLAALQERHVSGAGQIVDAAMVDGVPAIMASFHAMLARGEWTEERESNLLDGGAPFYRCYRCSDGKYISVGAIEPQFFAELVSIAGLPQADVAHQNDRTRWAGMRARYADHFAARSRDEWASLFEGSDACVAPVLTVEEAAPFSHNRSRATFLGQGKAVQAAPAPRFSRTPGAIASAPCAPGEHSDDVLHELGLGPDDIAALRVAAILT